MRVFKKYLPMMIAKHVKTFFKGRLYIHGHGRFDFDKGRLVMPDGFDNRHTPTAQEINLHIDQLDRA